MSNILMISDKYENYFKRVLEILKDSDSKICYVTFNKTYQYVLDEALKNDISKDRFFFIDCMTPTVVKPDDVDNCIFFSDLDNSDKMKEAISKIMKKGHTLLVFDSLSDLMNYNPGLRNKDLTNFILPLSEKIENKEEAAIYVCYKEDEGEISQEVSSVFNKFIRSFRILGT